MDKHDIHLRLLFRHSSAIVCFEPNKKAMLDNICLDNTLTILVVCLYQWQWPVPQLLHLIDLVLDTVYTVYQYHIAGWSGSRHIHNTAQEAVQRCYYNLKLLSQNGHAQKLHRITYVMLPAGAARYRQNSYCLGPLGHYTACNYPSRGGSGRQCWHSAAAIWTASQRR